MYFLGRGHRFGPPAPRGDLRKQSISSMSQDESISRWSGLNE